MIDCWLHDATRIEDPTAHVDGLQLLSCDGGVFTRVRIERIATLSVMASAFPNDGITKTGNLVFDDCKFEQRMEFSDETLSTPLEVKNTTHVQSLTLRGDVSTSNNTQVTSLPPRE